MISTMLNKIIRIGLTKTEFILVSMLSTGFSDKEIKDTLKLNGYNFSTTLSTIKDKVEQNIPYYSTKIRNRRNEFIAYIHGKDVFYAMED